MTSNIGLDIGSRSIKLIELEKQGNAINLLSAGSMPAPAKTLNLTVEADAEAMAFTIKKLVKATGARSRSVNISLPESQVFTRVIEMPPLSDKELASALQWQAEQYIPLPLDQVNMDFSVLRGVRETGTNKIEVLLVASPKALIERYLNYLELAELNAEAIETEIIAVSRSLLRSMTTVRSALVVSLGHQTTDLAILRQGVLAFTRSISAGGDAISRALEQGLGLEISQAEEFKKAYGLEPDKLEGKILAAVKPVMDTIISELRRSIAFYQERNPNERVEVILLAGGSAKIPGMVVFIAENMGLGIEVQLANPWLGINRDKRFSVLDADGPSFCVPVGLALR